MQESKSSAQDAPKPFNDGYLLRNGFRQVAHYPYTDASGNLLFEKLRYERSDPKHPKGREKTLTYRHRSNGGGWFFGAGTTVERPLYRLQNLIIAGPDEPVFICESEKVCDRLAEVNLLGTCVAAGWPGGDLEALRGRNCFVLEDNDAAGRGKALAAASAAHKIASSVQIVRSPSLPDGQNLADRIGDGFCAQEFVNSCRGSPHYQPDQPPKKGGKADEDDATLVWECIADVEPEKVDWIWTDRIARGKLTLISGDPGLGKSQISLDIASRITTCSRFPDGQSGTQGSILILSAEDAAKDTLRPRLEAVGADLKRVHYLKAVVVKGGGLTTFSLQHDLRALGEKLSATKDVVLVIIDPITSYMGKIDSHRTTDVRSVLEPLHAFAEKHHVAVLAISHPPKGTQAKALHAVTGSYAFVAAPRLVFIVVEEPETELRLLLAVKNTHGSLAPGLGYRLAQTIVSKNIVASHIVWDHAPVTMTANEAVAATGDHAAMTEAKEFLRQELTDGPRPTQEIKKAAQGAGLSWRTIRRAQDLLGIKPRKVGIDGGWQWELPNPEGGQCDLQDAQS